MTLLLALLLLVKCDHPGQLPKVHQSWERFLTSNRNLKKLYSQLYVAFSESFQSHNKDILSLKTRASQNYLYHSIVSWLTNWLTDWLTDCLNGPFYICTRVPFIIMLTLTTKQLWSNSSEKMHLWYVFSCNSPREKMVWYTFAMSMLRDRKVKATISVSKVLIKCDLAANGEI